MLELNKIYCMDCLEGMKKLEDNSIDLVVTDPPYNLGKDFKNDNLSKEEYLHWCKEWISELNRVLKWGGSIWITLGFQCVAEIKNIFNNYNPLRLKNWIVWYRQDGWKGDKGFAHSHEHILYFIKDNVPEKLQAAFREYLNTKRVKKGLSLSDINKHFNWATTGGGCASSYMGKKETNFLPTQKHYELLKGLFNLDNRFDWLPFGVKFNKVDECNDLWLTPKSEKNRLGHPTQKPVTLFERIIKASSNPNELILDPFMGSGTPNELILDPFMGSGTTAVACKQLGRNFIGFEINPEYVKIANDRLKQEVLISNTSLLSYSTTLNSPTGQKKQ